MSEKVLLVLVDGMRPDGILKCGNSFAAEFIRKNKSIPAARTVMPSVTLPCHMSLFHSVQPQRHGILTNIYTPQVRPIDGLFEQLDSAGKKCAAFYNWEELRDVSRPDILACSCFLSVHKYENTDGWLTDRALSFIRERSPDFVFLYLGQTDACGHKFGWMSDEYLNRVSQAWDCIKKLYDEISGEYAFIVTADHGGHDRTHGTDSREDMTIPIIISAKQEFNIPAQGSILDIAPTITALMGVDKNEQWEGNSLLT